MPIYHWLGLNMPWVWCYSWGIRITLCGEARDGQWLIVADLSMTAKYSLINENHGT